MYELRKSATLRELYDSPFLQRCIVADILPCLSSYGAASPENWLEHLLNNNLILEYSPVSKHRYSFDLDFVDCNEMWSPCPYSHTILLLFMTFEYRDATCGMVGIVMLCTHRYKIRISDDDGKSSEV